MERIILASQSSRRAFLLRQARIPFRVLSARISEKTAKKTSRKIVKELALRKAMAVAKKLNRGIVLGADTIVVVKGIIIGKPRNEKDALHILNTINGRINFVYTGVALVDAASGKKIVQCEESKVLMRRLPDKKLRKLAKKHLDKAGAYAVQEKDDAFVKKVIGDYTNVVGLPIPLVKKVLKKIRS